MIFKCGLSIRKLKEILESWPETDFLTGEDTEVWILFEEGFSSQVNQLERLNNNDIILKAF